MLYIAWACFRNVLSLHYIPDSAELGTVKLTVVVQDVNDSPPRFTDAQKQNQIFGVPSTAKANYLVTTLKVSLRWQDYYDNSIHVIKNVILPSEISIRNLLGVGKPVCKGRFSWL